MEIIKDSQSPRSLEELYGYEVEKFKRIAQKSRAAKLAFWNVFRWIAQITFTFLRLSMSHTEAAQLNFWNEGKTRSGSFENGSNPVRKVKNELKVRAFETMWKNKNPL